MSIITGLILGQEAVTPHFPVGIYEVNSVANKWFQAYVWPQISSGSEKASSWKFLSDFLL